MGAVVGWLPALRRSTHSGLAAWVRAKRRAGAPYLGLGIVRAPTLLIEAGAPSTWVTL
jgi:hypothetical protein